MADLILLQNLADRRARLQGEVEATDRRLATLRGDLDTIDRMIRLIDAGTDPSTIKGIRPHRRLQAFRQGEQTRLVYEALRLADAPLTVPELVEVIARRKEVANTPELRSRLRSTLGRLMRQGRLTRSGKPRSVRWTLRGQE